MPGWKPFANDIETERTVLLSERTAVIDSAIWGVIIGMMLALAAIVAGPL